MNIDTILYVVAFVCFVLAAFGVTVNKVNLIGAGLAAWVLTLLVGG